MKNFRSSIMFLLAVGLAACNKDEKKPSPYQSLSYHIYQKTTRTPYYSDTVNLDTNVVVQVCPDSLVWKDNELYDRVLWDSSRVIYAHHLGYPYFVQFYNNKNKVEWRFENGANTRNWEYVSYWANKL
ncbi:MAG TPA: hypothetical protein VFL76_08965 [Edaphocola sp.]|nr:hypothetical protein [Edaphocola sp.]